MEYTKKYLKYKQKYLLLKKGGGLNNNDRCAFCYEQMENINENKVELNCGHVYHYHCVFDYLEFISIEQPYYKCPTCNAKINTIYNVTEDLTNSVKSGLEKNATIQELHQSITPMVVLYEKPYNFHLFEQVHGTFEEKRRLYKLQKAREEDTPQMRQLRLPQAEPELLYSWNHNADW